MTTTIGKLNVEMPEDAPVVRMTRTFNAPRELVFKAHTSCEHMSKWWGPRTTSFESCDINFVEGGSWRIVLKDSGDGPAPFKGTFKTIVAPERLVWTFCYDIPPMDVEVEEEMVFTEHDGLCTITTTSYAPSFEAREGMAGSGMFDGAADTYDRLEEYVIRLG